MTFLAVTGAVVNSFPFQPQTDVNTNYIVYYKDEGTSNQEIENYQRSPKQLLSTGSSDITAVLGAATLNAGEKKIK